MLLKTKSEILTKDKDSIYLLVDDESKLSVKKLSYSSLTGEKEVKDECIFEVGPSKSLDIQQGGSILVAISAQNEQIVSIDDDPKEIDISSFSWTGQRLRGFAIDESNRQLVHTLSDEDERNVIKKMRQKLKSEDEIEKVKKTNNTNEKKLQSFIVTYEDNEFKRSVAKPHFEWKPLFSSDGMLKAQFGTDKLTIYYNQKMAVQIPACYGDYLSINYSSELDRYFISFVQKNKIGKLTGIFIYNLGINKEGESVQELTKLNYMELFKGDNATTKWSASGKTALISIHTEASMTSYSGEQKLYSMNIDGNATLVQLPVPGSVYSFEWSPICDEYVAVYGRVPAQAGIFSSSNQLLHKLMDGNVNLAKYSPHGNLVLVGGFGAMRTNAKIFNLYRRQDVQKKMYQSGNVSKSITELSTLALADITMVKWMNDSAHLLIATHSPRLNVNNQYSIIDYYGNQKIHLEFKALFNVMELFPPKRESPTLLPFDANTKTTMSITNNKDMQSGDIKSVRVTNTTESSVYVPPSQRRQQQITPIQGGELKKLDKNVYRQRMKKLEKKLTSITEAKEKKSKGLPIDDEERILITTEESILKKIEELKLRK
ncbi:hypothetical protein SNEBB_006856 [Seison nebaliae]|nr:hypothetical protein SNEBB_006856 [Seison nebaliae]